ncbi:MAG: hypothetical protein ACG0KC_01765 [Enterobacteriaceae bacterium]
MCDFFLFFCFIFFKNILHILNFNLSWILLLLIINNKKYILYFYGFLIDILTNSCFGLHSASFLMFKLIIKKKINFSKKEIFFYKNLIFNFVYYLILKIISVIFNMLLCLFYINLNVHDIIISSLYNVLFLFFFNLFFLNYTPKIREKE